MNCPVCLQKAEAIPPRGNYQDVDCPGCGRFKFTGTLKAIQADKVFDVPEARARLEQRRQGDEVPMLSSDDADLLRDK